MDNDDKHNDIKYSSKNIKKKDLNFNVEAKKTINAAGLFSKIGQWFKNLGQNFKNFWKKLTTSLFKGKNKFIIIGFTSVLIVAGASLPFILPQLTTPPEPTVEEEEIERRRSEQAVSNTVNHVDLDTPDEALEAVLSAIDDKISAASDAGDAETATFLTVSKGTVYLNSGDALSAIELYESSLGDLYSQQRFTELFHVYDAIVTSYEKISDYVSAISWAEKAIEVGEKVTAEYDEFYDYVGIYYAQRIEEIKSNEDYQEGVTNE